MARAPAFARIEIKDMVRIVSLPNLEGLEGEACAWVARIDGGAMSDADHQALKEWIVRSPQHKRTFEKAAAAFMELRSPFTARATAQKPAANIKPVFGWLRPLGAFAAVAATVAVIAVAIQFRYGAPIAAPVTYYAETGQQKTVTLADGSEIILNTNTRIDVKFSPEERAVDLVYGEALFSVAKDPQRPFQVYTDKGIVRAVGTVFSVRVRRADIEVIVEEGIVEVAPSSARHAPEVGDDGNNFVAPVTKLTPGSRAKFDETTQTIVAIDAQALDKTLSWREGVLVFDVDPLSYVVEEVSRYTDIRIVISDPEILNIPVGGNFRVGETQALLDALEEGFGIEVQRVSDDLVYLSPKS
jgi:transmembrane sensor